MTRIIPCCILFLLAVDLAAQGSEIMTVLDLSPQPTLISIHEVKEKIAEEPVEKATVINANYAERAVDTKDPERSAAVEARTTKCDRDEADENAEYPDVIENQSMIRLGRLAHVHVAVDHESLNLPVIRTHQYRELHQYASFGPGVFFQYDMRIKVDGGGGNGSRVHSPMDTVEIIVSDKDQDGIGTSHRSNSIRSLCYYDEAFDRLILDGAVTTPVRTADIKLAKSAVLTTWSNERYYFELVDLSGDGGDIRGRLRWIEDAAGLAIRCDYVYTDASLPATRDRAALFMLKRVLGRGGERLAKFIYTDELVGNAYAITGIRVRGRGWIRYDYGDPAKDLTPEEGDDLVMVNTNWDAATNPIITKPSELEVFGLSRIRYPEGDASTFESGIDWQTRCATVHFVDVKDVGGHGDSEILLNLSTWWPADADPLTYGWEEFEAARAAGDDQPVLVRQADNLIRMVVDTDDNQCTFFSWYGRNYENREAVFYYQSDDAIFGGPRLAQYASVGGYPYYTQYANHWWQADYEGWGSLLETAQMGWGSKESYAHNTWYWVYRYSGDLGRNGNVNRNSTTGLITNTTDDPAQPPVWR